MTNFEVYTQVHTRKGTTEMGESVIKFKEKVCIEGRGEEESEGRGEREEGRGKSDSGRVEQYKSRRVEEGESGWERRGYEEEK